MKGASGRCRLVSLRGSFALTQKHTENVPEQKTRAAQPIMVHITPSLNSFSCVVSIHPRGPLHVAFMTSRISPELSSLDFSVLLFSEFRGFLDFLEILQPHSLEPPSFLSPPPMPHRSLRAQGHGPLPRPSDPHCHTNYRTVSPWTLVIHFTLLLGTFLPIHLTGLPAVFESPGR